MSTTPPSSSRGRVHQNKHSTTTACTPVQQVPAPSSGTFATEAADHAHPEIIPCGTSGLVMTGAASPPPATSPVSGPTVAVTRHHAVTMLLLQTQTLGVTGLPGGQGSTHQTGSSESLTYPPRPPCHRTLPLNRCLASTLDILPLQTTRPLEEAVPTPGLVCPSHVVGKGWVLIM